MVDFLGLILQIQNSLSTKKITGFKLSSLKELANVKSPNNSSVTLLQYVAQKLDPDIASFVTKDLNDALTIALLSLNEIQSFIPIVLKELSELDIEMSASNSELEKEWKNAMTSFSNNAKKEVQNVNKEIKKIDEGIVFLGDNQDLGIGESAVKSNADIELSWKILEKLYPNYQQRLKRDQERIGFFRNINEFCGKLKAEVNSINEANLKKKRKLESEQKRLARLEKKVEFKTEGNAVNNILNVGINTMRKNREMSVDKVVSSKDNMKNSLSLTKSILSVDIALEENPINATDPLTTSELKNQLKQSRNFR